MTEHTKLIKLGKRKAVVLPEDCKFPGDEVRVTRVSDGILIQPMFATCVEWFAAIDACGMVDAFGPGWRNQPRTPKHKLF